MPSAPPSDVRIIINGKAQLTNWVRYQIESDMMTPADAFSFTVANPNGELTGTVRKFDTVKVLVNGSVQMVGYVDEVTYTVDAQSGSVMEIAGRDTFGQLIDVSATPQTITKLDLGQIATKICAPFVVTWIYDNEANAEKLRKAKRRIALASGDITNLVLINKALRDTEKDIARNVLDPTQSIEEENKRIADLNAEYVAKHKRIDEQKNKKIAQAKANLAALRKAIYPRVKIEPGDSPLDVLTPLAERAGFMLWMSADGRGVIAKPNYAQDASFTIRQYPLDHPDRVRNNALTTSVSDDGRDLFNEYRIVGHAANTIDTFGEGSRFDETITDDAVLRLRKKIVSSSGQNKREVREEVLRDQQRRLFESLELNYVVKGHVQNKLLWTVDCICRVEDMITGQSGDFYITRRRFTADQGSGQRTEISLRRPGVLLP